MDCPYIPILGACAVGATLGAGFYGAAAYQKKVFSGFMFLEAMTQGFLLAGALHLMLCILCPEQLIEIFDKQNGRPINLKVFNIKIENIHAVEIFIASIMLGITSGRALKSIWEKPGH
jgi:hypothetical protein